MTNAQLLELIANDENSGVEFKRDGVRPEQIAKEIVALANLQGGRLLLVSSTTATLREFSATAWNAGWIPCSVVTCIR